MKPTQMFESNVKESSPKRKYPGEMLIRQEIERFGPMTFERFTDIALYHPRYGYYNQISARRGRQGDYFTSLQVGSLFPIIFAHSLVRMKETLGTEQFSVIEVGSGDGEFLEGVLSELNRMGKQKGFRVWSVERSRPARDALWRRLSRFPKCEIVSSVDDIEWLGTLEGCIFSNEFFDALPFHRLRWNGSVWEELFVTLTDGQLAEIAKEATIPVVALPAPTVVGHEIEVRPQIESILETWSQRLSRGFVVTIDYGHPQAAFYDPIRSKGTWNAFYRHKVSQAIFDHIGDQDITAHIDFSQLLREGEKAGFDPAHFCSQGIFLTYEGKDLIPAYLEASSDEERKKRAGVVQQLIHPSAMGEKFWVFLQTKGVECPSSLMEVPNRLRRLTAPIL